MNATSLRASVLLCALVAACSSNPEAVRQKHVAAGAKYVEQKQYDKAIVEYSNALKDDRKAGDVQFALAEAYAAAGNVRAAFPAYVAAADLMPNNLVAQLRAGQLLLKGGMFEEAKKRARNVLQKDPKNVEGLVLLGNALAGLKDLDNAVSVIQRASEIDPERAGIYSNLAVFKLAQGQSAEAEAAFKRAVDVSHESTNSLVSLANFYRAAGRPAEAENVLSRAYAKDPKSLAVNETIAGVYLDTGRVTQAESYLRAAVNVSDTPDPRYSLASYYVLVGKYSQAIEVLQALATSHPKEQADANIRIAIIEFGTGDVAAANKRIDAILAKSPRHGAALTTKARLLLAQGKPQGALTMIKRALAAEPRMGDAHLTLGRVNMALGNVEEARKAFTNALEVMPTSLPAALELSELHLNRGDTDSARQYADLAVRNHPDSLPARLLLVRILLVRGDPGVDDQLKVLLAKYPTVEPVYAASGRFALSKNDQAVARRSFERALELNPDSVEAASGVLALDLAAKRFPEARARLATLLSHRHRVAGPYLLAASVYSILGEPDQTEAMLKQALSIEPSNPEVHGRLGEFYATQGRLDDAKNQFAAILKVQPRSVGAMSILGLFAYAQKDYAEAKRWWEAALKIDPNSAAAANNLAALFADTGESLDAALDLAQIAKRQFPDSADVDDTIGWVQFKRGLTLVAIRYLERSAEKQPRNPQFAYHLGMAYAKYGQDEKAREQLKKALQLSSEFDGAAEARATLSSLVY